MGRDKNRKGHDTTRDSGGFVAIPWSVLDSAAYLNLSHPAKTLLMDIARQFVRDNNGRLLASRAHLAARGWKSNDTITRAIRELVAAKLIHQTVQGQRPNKASWYAVTWRTLDRIPGFDVGAIETFERSAYLKPALKNTSLRPTSGTGRAFIAPPNGTGNTTTTPPNGTIKGVLCTSSIPPDGHHLEKPSQGAETKLKAMQDVEKHAKAKQEKNWPVTKS